MNEEELAKMVQDIKSGGGNLEVSSLFYFKKIISWPIFVSSLGYEWVMGLWMTNATRYFP